MRDEPPREPTYEQADAHELIEFGGRQGYACWYPQMGGYVSVAVVAADADGCLDVWVWHNGEFPFSGLHHVPGDVSRSPAELHHCDPGQFIAFGRFAAAVLDDASDDKDPA